MRTLIIYHYIAHYRKPIFEELQSSDRIEFKFASGFIVDSDIKVLQPEEFSYTVLNNKWFFKGRILWQKKLLSLIQKDYDHFIFLGNPYFVSTWFAIIYCKLSNKNASIWTHGVTLDLQGLKLNIFKILWQLSSKIFVYGNFAKEKMISYGVNSEKIVVVYNSLDYKRQVSVREKLNKTNVFYQYFNNEFPVLIFSGRLTKIKKLDQILNAIKILKDEKLPCNILFIGDGLEKDNLKNIAVALGLEKQCWFYGACYDENIIGEFYINSRICVSPGNVGLTAMHSMVYGTPVVTHSDFQNQMPEFEAIEDGVTGSFFEINNIEKLATKIKFWINMEESSYSICSKKAMSKIDTLYNPSIQRKVFENSLLST